MVILIKQLLTEVKKVWENYLKNGGDKEIISKAVKEAMKEVEIIESKAFKRTLNNMKNVLLLNSLGYEASCDIENITDSEAMRKVIKKTLDNAVNDIFQSSHNKVVSTEKGGIFMLDLALENDKAKQKRIYEILDLITIALEKDSLEGYQQLYENWNEAKEYNFKKDYDCSLFTFHLYLDLNYSIAELQKKYSVEVEKILNNPKLQSIEPVEQYFEISEVIENLKITQEERKVEHVQSEVKELLTKTKEKWENYLQLTSEEKKEKNYFLYLALGDESKKEKQEKFNNTLKWITEALCLDTWESYKDLEWKWNDNSAEYKADNDYDGRSLAGLSSLLKEWRKCSLVQLKEIRAVLGLESSDCLAVDWENQLNTKLVNLRERIGLESLKTELLGEKLGVSKLNDIPTSDTLETILKKNEDLQNNLEKRTSAMENQFGEITKKLEKKVQENKDLEKSLKQTQNSLSKLEGISQEKDKLAKELNEIVNLQEHLTQSLKRTKEEVTSLKTQTKLEVDKAVEKIEKLERELVKKEGEIKNFQQSLERISTTATEDYKFLLEIPPRTPKTPPIN